MIDTIGSISQRVNTHNSQQHVENIANQKEQSIETLRGIAIILMVIGHVIGGDSNSGMSVAPESGWRYFYYSLQFLRMPLFTVISGYVYALRPVGQGDVLNFLKGKSRRILLPLFAVSTIQYLMRTIVPGVNKPASIEDIWRIYIYPFDQFWFLQAIFLVFLTLAALDRCKVLNTVNRWAFALCLAIIFTWFMPHFTTVFGFVEYLYLLPFFLLGYGLNRYRAYLAHKEVIIVASGIFVLGLTIQQWAWFANADVNLDRDGYLSIAVGLTGILILFSFRKENFWLAQLGFYAYSIYLFHVFGSASNRIFLTGVGIQNELLIFVCGVFFGLFVPIIAELMLVKNNLLRLIFLGSK